MGEPALSHEGDSDALLAPDPGQPDQVTRRFTAARSNELWVADLTYVTTWQGFVYVAFVIDLFAGRIVGWRISSSLRSDLVLDALSRPSPIAESEWLVHHRDRGASDRRSRARGVHTIVQRHRPWKESDNVDLATLEWIASYNKSRQLEPIEYVSPTEFERPPAGSTRPGATRATSSPENPARFIPAVSRS